MRLLLASALIALPAFAFAAGGGDESPPKPTQTTKDCWGKRVWDVSKQRCVRPKQSSLNDDQLYDAVRELAYAGRYEGAEAALDAMSNAQDDRVLTYRGFINRKLGNLDAANVFYTAAIQTNPNNILARSYMGQGFVAESKIEAAEAQLLEIEKRGGAKSWAATSLRRAIYSGATYNY